jgi:hypothetical protein
MDIPLDHDQRFKELLRERFADFLHLFFADFARRFDLSAVEWLDKELFDDPPDGGKHAVDLVAKVQATEPIDPDSADPTTWLALVHVEVESPDKTTRLKPRLPGYYFRLRAKHDLPVLPIVLYLKVGLDGIGVDTVVERFWEHETFNYRYLYVGLPGLNAEDYVGGENWLGVALSALMRMPPGRAAELGAEALRRISDAPVTERQRFLLGECVEAYLDLPVEEEERFRAILEANAGGKLMPRNKTSFDLGLEEGMEKGREEGELLARRAMLFELLEAKSGPVPADLAAKFAAETAPGRLKQWLAEAVKAESLAAFRTAAQL